MSDIGQYKPYGVGSVRRRRNGAVALLTRIAVMFARWIPANLRIRSRRRPTIERTSSKAAVVSSIDVSTALYLRMIGGGRRR